MHFTAFSGYALLVWLTTAQDTATDPGVTGPPLEIVHLYYDQWPTENTNNGRNAKYAVAELFANNTERPYPSAEVNNPPGGAINYTTSPPSGTNYQDHLIGVQSVVIDALDRLWILDTGRAQTADGTLVPASPGGPKLVGVDLATDTVFKTIVFPPTVATPFSYLNDIRFDLRTANSSENGGGGGSSGGIAYMTDSSNEGRNAIVVVDLASGAAWRRLDGNPGVRAEPQFVAHVWGEPIYDASPGGGGASYLPTGADGIALSADGGELFWGPVAGRALYGVPTARLRARGGGGSTAEVLAQASVVRRGQKGVSDGFETDSNGLVYVGNMEQNAVNWYSPANGTTGVFVRDPRINWVDTLSIAEDGYLYFTVNQLFRAPMIYPGTDRRVRPYVLFRVKLPDGGSKVLLR
ncbi:major royal jelly protein [Diplodia corticola]|uniref:Major royal jelly protein n=1 Tax=Diplodia corticola TaxID=236234 RepID=A0A1J9R9C0_9PEZI|nr:major royal jelly protein [Diplodia corticola]OJD37089.1 major royal jelly protein [Diplodia corticola]